MAVILGVGRLRGVAAQHSPDLLPAHLNKSKVNLMEQIPTRFGLSHYPLHSLVIAQTHQTRQLHSTKRCLYYIHINYYCSNRCLERWSQTSASTSLFEAGFLSAFYIYDLHLYS